jgi:primosomal protein N' (replication factor Y)
MFFMARATEPTFPGLPGRQRTTVKRESIAGSLTPRSYQSRYASIALPVPVRRLFTYRIPEGMEGSAAAGCRAVVPFGRRRLTGIITGTIAEPDLSPSRLKDVTALPDAEPVIGRPLLGTLLWAARYYAAPPGPMLSAALPPGGRGSDAASAGATERFYSLRRDREEALGLCARAPRQRAIVELLAADPAPVSRSDLRDRIGDPGAALAALQRKRLIRVERRAVERAPELLPDVGCAPALSLTGEQKEAVAAIRDALGSGSYRGHLLVGPTGSGKTEVYLRSIEETLKRGKGAAYLVPEISLTPILSRTLRARFGSDFALLHSSLTPAQRRSEWRRLRTGEARVVLGPRSALFAPLGNLGLIVVDEEQDGSFKQESDPRYNARDLALVRARREGALALLGSATPSLESYRLAETGRLTLLRLTRRIEERPLARVDLVDMRREEEETGGADPVSRSLREALRDCLARREQAIIFLNRRGWAPAVLCKRCGESLKCRRCTIALTYHRTEKRLLCHYCGYHRSLPGSCLSCRSDALILAGQGTERLAEEVAALFPEARLARLDRDVARGRTAPGRILAAFERGEHDILVGTQLVAKGHDFPNVTLVGVVSADFSLGFPDFRAAERTFQVLTQVAGRAGRGDRPGRVIVQAYRPDHYALQAAAEQDYAAFYRKETRYRRLMGYPPYAAMANIVAAGKTLATAQRRAREAAAAIRNVGGEEVRISGPAIAPLGRLKGRYRIQIMVRAARRRLLSDVLNGALEDLERRPASPKDLIIDVDPASLL